MGDRRARGGALLIRALALLWIAVALVPVMWPSAPLSRALLDRHGALLGATVAADEQWRFESQPVPDRFATALVAFEDKRFHQHPGVDPIAVARALRLNLRAGEVRSGASTLTMQVVRIARGDPPRTIHHKLIEMVLALRLERALDKQEILALYAAHAPFGGNVVGVEAAAWRYFGRAIDTLSWAEVATLAVLPNSPALIHPGRNRDALRDKRDRLLERLAVRGVLSEDDLHLARLEPLPEAPLTLPQVAPHLMMRAGEARTVTTIDGALQRQARAIVERHSERWAGNGVHNAAALIVDVPTGEVRAWMGNVGGLVRQDHHNHVDIVTAPRSTGSTLKPFLYGAMVERGELMPTQLVPDVPTHLEGFAPENFDRRHDGALRAPEALARSRNVPAVWMLQQFGVDRFHGLLGRAGMGTLHRPAEDYGLTLILGGAEGTLHDLVGLYRGLAWSASQSGPMPALHWTGTPETDAGHRLDPAAAWLTLDALLDVHRPGAQAAWQTYASGQEIAWKTGTSFGFRDAWAIGVTPRVAIGVWVGNADGEGRPGLTGFEAAAPILFELFDAADHGHDGFRPPHAQLRSVRVCAHSGHLAGPDCAETTDQLVPRSSAAGAPCPYCQLLHLDADGFQVDARCEPAAHIRHEKHFVLPPAMAWYRRLRSTSYTAPPPIRPDCSSEDRAFTLVYPGPRSEVYVPIELDGTRGRVVFEASHRDRDGRLFWHLDDRFVATTEHDHQVALAPMPGRHTLTVVDAEGARLVRPFTVLDASL